MSDHEEDDDVTPLARAAPMTVELALEIADNPTPSKLRDGPYVDAALVVLAAEVRRLRSAVRDMTQILARGGDE